MANFAAQLRDRFFGLVDRVTGCGRAGVREEAPKSAPAPAVQESYSCVARELTVLLITLAACRDSTERPRCVRRIGGGSQLDTASATRSPTFVWLPLF
ncbi:hypothetical protein ACQJBY_012456 [Aegilops geniculata]